MSFYISDGCVMCGKCPRVCPVQAISFDGELNVIDSEKCISCGACAKICPREAVFEEGYVAPEVVVEKREETLVKDCDYAIIGSGPAGLISAIRVAEQGHKVIIMEADKVLGGAGKYATFMRVFGTKWEKEAGLPDLTEDYIRAAMNCTHWELSHKLVSNAFHCVTEFFDWFCTWGEAEKVFAIAETPYCMSVDMIPGRPSAPYVTDKLIDKCKELGVEFMMNTRADELCIENNEIKAVMAKDAAGGVKVNCKACLIATGNMAANPELDRFAPEYANAVKVRNGHRLPMNRGDGVRMVEKAGLPIDEKGIGAHYLGAMPCFFDGDVIQQGIRCEGVRVNANGKRFISECVNRFDATNQTIHQPKALTWNIVDSKILKQPMLPFIKLPSDIGGNLPAGLPRKGRPMPTVDFMGFEVPLDEHGNPIHSVLLDEGGANAMVKRQAAMEEKLAGFESLRGGQVSVANTIEELAEKMGVPKDALVETINRYNEMSKNGKDEDFSKYPNYMFPIENPPYYAFKCYLGLDGIFGGIFINDDCQVMGESEPVKGLYSGGDVTSGNFIMQNTKRYEIINDYTWAIASGFLAAKGVNELLATK